MSLFFDYDLPDRLIAQHPAERRDASRLLVVNRDAATIEHRRFADLPTYLQPGDCLVLNDTRVLPARLIGQREKTGGKWEGLFLRAVDSTWELLGRTRGYPEIGERFRTDSGLSLTLVDRTSERHWLMRPDSTLAATQLLQEHGRIPLPPYIRKGRAKPDDHERYQTVYAEASGSVAAPTAGLHFTPELLGHIRDRGITVNRVTLHVGIGTFAPIKADDPTQHTIHAEWCDVPSITIDAIESTKRRNGRVIAVGTTTVRSLETANRNPFQGESRLFIHPPYSFNTIDGMVTNFHLPRTTLLLMVQALTGSKLLRQAYTEAIDRDYRFYSYGDAMLIV